MDHVCPQCGYSDETEELQPGMLVYCHACSLEFPVDMMLEDMEAPGGMVGESASGRWAEADSFSPGGERVRYRTPAELRRGSLKVICRHCGRKHKPEYVSALVSPFNHIDSFLCEPCGKVLPLANFRWADGGESLASYRDRYRRMASSLELLLTSKLSLYILLAFFFLLFGSILMSFKGLDVQVMDVVAVIIGSGIFGLLGWGLLGRLFELRFSNRK